MEFIMTFCFHFGLYIINLLNKKLFLFNGPQLTRCYIMNSMNFMVDEDGRFEAEETDAMLKKTFSEDMTVEQFLANLAQPYESEVVGTVKEAIDKLADKVYDDMEGIELTEEIMETDVWLESNMNSWAGGLALLNFVEEQEALGLKCKFYMWGLEYDLNCFIVAE